MFLFHSRLTVLDKKDPVSLSRQIETKVLIAGHICGKFLDRDAGQFPLVRLYM